MKKINTANIVEKYYIDKIDSIVAHTAISFQMPKTILYKDLYDQVLEECHFEYTDKNGKELSDIQKANILKRVSTYIYHLNNIDQAELMKSEKCFETQFKRYNDQKSSIWAPLAFFGIFPMVYPIFFPHGDMAVNVFVFGLGFGFTLLCRSEFLGINKQIQFTNEHLQEYYGDAMNLAKEYIDLLVYHTLLDEDYLEENKKTLEIYKNILESMKPINKLENKPELVKSYMLKRR